MTDMQRLDVSKCCGFLVTNCQEEVVYTTNLQQFHDKLYDIFATNPQQVEVMESEPYCVVSSSAVCKASSAKSQIPLR